MKETLNSSSSQSNDDVCGDQNALREFLKYKRRNQKLTIRISDGLVIVKPSQVLYCEASGSYTLIYLTTGEKFVSARTMKYYENLLPENFFRIHASFLVNVDYLFKYINGRGGKVELAGGVQLSVSRDRKQELMVFINKWS